MPGATTDKHAQKGCNYATMVNKRPGPHKGMVTDGADLMKGHKVVKPDHTQKGAFSPHNKSNNMKHHY